MQSKMTQSKMNSLFQDTRMFNVSSAQYNSNFSKPGALELLDKDYDSVYKKSSTQNLHLDFSTIRENQKSTNHDISLLTNF